MPSQGPMTTSRSDKDQREINDIEGRIFRAIIRLAEGQSSRVRSLLDRYIPVAGASMAKFGEDRLPRSVRVHPQHRGRCCDGADKVNLLLFHIGLAVLDLYELVGGNKTETLYPNLSRLERISKDPDSCRIYGDDPGGYMLATAEEIADWLRDARQTERELKEEDEDNIPE